MGKFLRNFKNRGVDVSKKVGLQAERVARKIQERERMFNNGRLHNKRREKIGERIHEGFGEEEFYDDKEMLESDNYDIGIQPAQKPESFHHFILENQYKDLERSIRGFKDVFNKNTQQWETKRKEDHCFTDEEAEEILRTAQSHLATDIKLSYINKEVFGEMMMAIFKRLDELFYSIAEYRYGRYGEPEVQYVMKLQNRKIFLELWTRVQANYSRAIQGQENKATHGSVQGQESLQQSDRLGEKNRGYL